MPPPARSGKAALAAGPAFCKTSTTQPRSRTCRKSHILALIDALQDALERVGAGGLLFVLDELGKFL